MPEHQTILITPVPGQNERCRYRSSLPDGGHIWGEVSGNPLEAMQTVQRAGMPFAKIIYTACRAEQDATPAVLRHLFLAQASGFFDLVELKFGRDTTPELLNRIPPAMRLISAELPAAQPMEAVFAQMAALPARLYKITLPAVQSGDELLPLALLHQLGRKDVIAYATGPIGAWTRIVAPALGAPAICATLAEDPQPDGALPVCDLMRDYGLPRTPRFQYLYGIAGNPVFRSLSPRLHNAAYRRLDIPGLFVPFHISDFETFHRAVVQSPLLSALGLEIRGLTVVSPFKEAGFRVADQVEHPVSRQTKSCNLLAKRKNAWIGDSTDPLAILEALHRLEIAPRDLRAGVIGCGGAGRAIAATLADAGAKVVLFNRTPARGEFASRQLNVPFDLLHNLAPERFDILVNATPLGKHAHERPFDPDRLGSASVFIDYAYGKHTTAAVEALRDRGVGCVDGREVLIIQVRRQFEVMTGEAMPEALAVRQAFEPEADHLVTVSSKNIAL